MAIPPEINTSSVGPGMSMPVELHKFEYAALIGRVTKTVISLVVIYRQRLLRDRISWRVDRTQPETAPAFRVSSASPQRPVASR